MGKDISAFDNDGKESIRLPRITDVAAKCKCGWWGTIGDCEPDVDGDGALGCPECFEIVETIHD